MVVMGRSGWAGLVWVLPVVALVVGLAGVAAAFARWRRAPRTHASAADRALVDQALARARTGPRGVSTRTGTSRYCGPSYAASSRRAAGSARSTAPGVSAPGRGTRVG